MPVMPGAAIGQSALAVGSASGPTTVSSSYADLTDMSVTLTTRGGVLLCDFVSIFSHSTLSASVTVAFSLDAAAEVGAMGNAEPVISTIFIVGSTWRFSGVAAGSHTIKVRWLTSAATATAVGTFRQLRVQEVPA